MSSAFPPAAGRDAGFLTADAMVGLFILALGVTAVMVAGSTSMRVAASARHMRLALARAEMCLQSDWPGLARPGVRRGRTRDGLLLWSLTSRPSQTSPLLCEVECSASAAAGGARVVLHTVRLCSGAASNG